MSKFEVVSYSQFEKDFSSTFTGATIEENYSKIKLPEAATTNSVGYDFFTYFDFDLKPGEEIKIPTGIKVQLNKNLILLTIDQDGISLPVAVNQWLGVYPRSSTGFKYLRVANTVGIIDADYYNNPSNEGHIWVKVRNESQDKNIAFKEGEAFCQGVIQLALFAQDDNRKNQERQGGIGSTNA